ncbi:MAG: primase catalytic core, N-terminal domain [Marmoricola sp.]|nr:primase catalytic core, N-terminal domain [Marmoricola sp.]
MTLHKLSAGEGYTYLTRQVAVHDASERSQAGMAEYYAEKGETPGRWLGAGLEALGLKAGEQVVEEQMVALFGHGHHPGKDEVGLSVPLGREFPTYSATTLRMETARAFSDHNRTHGLPAGAEIPADLRAGIRSDAARQRFEQKHGRAPTSDREFAGFMAQESQPSASAVSGYDLTFSPVKSVSALWALAPPEVAAQIEAAHDAAVTDVIGWLEHEVAYTRTGRAGARQVPVTGLVAAAFTHRDSRAGDPDLHTHVAVANKVQARAEYGGAWLALDGRILFKAKVAASERYNTRLEAELVDRLGVRFIERRARDGKRTIREIAGVDPMLLDVWSKRRTAITIRRDRLAGHFQVEHGRPPTPIEARALAQQANLETREMKHEPRSQAEQRATWRTEATDYWIDPDALVDAVVGGAVGTGIRSQARHSHRFDEDRLHATAQRVVTALEASRATWQVWHVRAEVDRQIRAAEVPLEQLDQVAGQLIDHVLEDLSVRVDVPDVVDEPEVLRRRDGASVYDVHGSDRYSSQRILDAEQTVLAAARLTDGRSIEAARVSLAIAEAADVGRSLDPSQAALVMALATSGARVQVAIAPAGTGKTTSMRVLADAWRATGGTVLGLAPSAVAARELSRALADDADTLAKLTTDLSNTLTTGRSDMVTSGLTGRFGSVGPGTLIVVDEAGMAATGDLATLVRFALETGASVRLIGDDQQLAAVAAGGLLRDLVSQTTATSLSVVHRFDDSAEAAASLAIRAGETVGLGFYTDHQRIHVGTPGTAADLAYRGWQIDRASGLDSLLLAPTGAVATELNRRARTDRLADQTTDRTAGPSVSLRDGNHASAGDLVVTRRNERRLIARDTDWVKNGDRWRVAEVRSDGALIVARVGATRIRVILPANYVAQHVQLGYATTVHTAQGMTVDTSHTVLSGEESRQLLYVALSRGRVENHLYLASDTGEVEESGLPTALPPTLVQTLRGILARDGSQVSATTAHREATDPAGRLHDAVLRYDDAMIVAAQRHHVDLTEITLGGGPLPWLHGIPSELAQDPEWAKYLRERSQLISTLADEVRVAADPAAPWADGLAPSLVRAVAVWRAAYGIPDSDPRPTGPTTDGLGWHHQRDLNRHVQRLVEDRVDWSEHLPSTVTADTQSAALARRLDDLQRRRPDVALLIQKSLDEPRPLPVENPADALWWRVVAADATLPKPNPEPAVAAAPQLPSQSASSPWHTRQPERAPGIAR